MNIDLSGQTHPLTHTQHSVCGIRFVFIHGYDPVWSVWMWFTQGTDEYWKAFLYKTFYVLKCCICVLSNAADLHFSHHSSLWCCKSRKDLTHLAASSGHLVYPSIVQRSLMRNGLCKRRTAKKPLLLFSTNTWENNYICVDIIALLKNIYPVVAYEFYGNV